MSDLVSIATLEGVAIISLDTPERINAISLEMRDALIAAFNQCFLDDSCNAIVLTGSGGNFSSGGDLKSGRPAPELVARTLRQKLGRLHELVRLICNSPKPVVAAVTGKAFGAGMSLAVACDVVVAEKNAQFCAIFGKVGLIPDAGLLYTLPRRVGAAKSQHILLSARVVGAEEAADIGLADVLAEPADLLATACAEARRLTAIAPLAFAEIKSLMNGSCATLEEAFAAELRIQPMLALTQDNTEARTAFAERRQPAFRGY
jgi:2-(1,2-epoxy-1,2-dihydrophenyl)acetyl-CoA isomerase